MFERFEGRKRSRWGERKGLADLGLSMSKSGVVVFGKELSERLGFEDEEIVSWWWDDERKLAAMRLGETEGSRIGNTQGRRFVVMPGGLRVLAGLNKRKALLSVDIEGSLIVFRERRSSSEKEWFERVGTPSPPAPLPASKERGDGLT